MARRAPRSRTSPRPPGALRIIGGRWRGRKLPIIDLPGLRPTPDRVRETLFNWLGPDVVGARCLDLFAGSGALGFEALSRGAASADLVERDPRACDAIRENLERLDANEGRVITSDALQWLQGEDTVYELVFLDPPFGNDLLNPAIAALDSGSHLAPGARIYIESGADEPPCLAPASWSLLRERRAGQVVFALYSANNDHSNPD